MWQPQSDMILLASPTPMPLEEFRREFLALYQPPMAAVKTGRKYRYVLDRLAELGATSTADLTPELVARFLTSRPSGESPYTTQSYLCHLRTICSQAEGRRLLSVSPFRLRKLSKWLRVPTSPPGHRHHSRDDVRAVLALMRQDADGKRGWAQWRARRLYALTSLIAHTGLRANEALRLWVEDLDLVGGVIDLRPRPARWPREGDPAASLKTTASAQPIALPRAVVPVLEEWLAHRLDAPEGVELPPLDRIPWIFPGTFRQGAWQGGPPGRRPVDRLQAVAARVGLEGMTFVSLRRSWATWAEADGVPPALIQRTLRHTSQATTERYYRRRDLDALRGAVGGFEV